jgi:putative serine protease PepD
MMRRLSMLAAVALLAIGFVGGYAVNASVGSGSAAADTAVTSSTVAEAGVSSTSINAGIESAFSAIQKSVVYVETVGVGTGSGIVFDTKGDIVTNDHVIAGGKTFKVTLWNGKTVPATLVGKDPADDLAVLHVNIPGLIPATFAPKSSYHLAETVLAVGSPLGLKDSVTDGLISGLNRTQQEPTGSYIPDAIQTSAPINPGNSGGALVDLNGEVVGIPTIVQTSTTNNESVQNVGFAIPSSRVSFIVPQIIKYGHVVNTGRAFLGISVADAGSQFSFFGQYSSSVSGAYVRTVKSGGPAAQAGLRVGDVITRLYGQSVTDSSDLLAALAQLKPGQTVNLTYNRDGTIRLTQITLGHLPATQ